MDIYALVFVPALTRSISDTSTTRKYRTPYGPHFHEVFSMNITRLKGGNVYPPDLMKSKTFLLTMFQRSCLCDQNQPIGICSWQL